MRHLVERKIVAGTEMEENLLQEPLLLSLPLTAVWKMSHAKVISLEQVIKSIYKNNSGKKTFLVNELLELLIYQRGNSSTQAASDVLVLLVDLTYSGSGSISQEWQPLAKFAGEVLQSLTEGVLDFILNISKNQHQAHKRESDKGSSKQFVEDHHLSYSQKHKKLKQEDEKEILVDNYEIPNMYQLVLENPRVPQEALEGFFTAQLVQTLTHRPNIKLTRVLKEQEVWCSAKANPTLVALMQKLVVGLGHEEALNVLELVLSNEEVSWGCVLTLVATTLTCHRATAARVKELIERNIRRGCEELENESMVVGFLFARHAGQEGRHLFPSYAQWFLSLFSPETSPAAQKQSFVFLRPWFSRKCLRNVLFRASFFCVIFFIVCGEYGLAVTIGSFGFIAFCLYLANKKHKRNVEWRPGSNSTNPPDETPTHINTVSGSLAPPPQRPLHLSSVSPPSHVDQLTPSTPTRNNVTLILSSQLSHAYYGQNCRFSSPIITSQVTQTQDTRNSVAPPSAWSSSTLSSVSVPSTSVGHMGMQATTQIAANLQPPAYPDVIEDDPGLPPYIYTTSTSDEESGKVFRPSTDELPSYEAAMSTWQSPVDGMHPTPRDDGPVTND